MCMDSSGPTAWRRGGSRSKLQAFNDSCQQCDEALSRPRTILALLETIGPDPSSK